MINEKHILRFQLRIRKSYGAEFQNLFVTIMRESYSDFRAVKAHGKEGDKGNDGWFPSWGRFYQVYGPEDIPSKTAKVIAKVHDDIEKVVDCWGVFAPLKEWIFVLDNKYGGICPEVQ